MIFDSHIHSSFSSDSKMRIEDAIKESRKKDIGLIITDHIDLNYPGERFKFDIGDYLNQYDKYKSSSLLIGIEIGMTLDFINENKAIADNFDLDQIIGSQHSVGKNDLYFPDYYQGITYKEAVEGYFREIINCLRTHSYIDTLGHIDYIARYAPVEDREIYYDIYHDLIDEVIKTCLDTNTVLEINTRRFGVSTAFDNLQRIYSRYKELGGKYVTIGSDAHNTETIAKNLKEALDLSELCNLKPVYFKNRKPQFF